MASHVLSQRSVALRTSLVLGALVGARSLCRLGAQQTFKVRLRPVPIEASTAANTIGVGDATAELAGHEAHGARQLRRV